FIGYLVMLLAMCIFMLYGCVLFWQTMCFTSLAKSFWRGVGGGAGGGGGGARGGGPPPPRHARGRRPANA
ncbi:MAG: hypothetical protein LBK99_20855, partial [Opitutaceae bacterium]|nr:hypothetical protein [Opitutaceae bacterium]